MRVHLIRKETIETFAISNSRSRSSLHEWLAKIKYADWLTPADMKETFASTDLLGRGSGRVVFDIAGNSYRIICKYAFGEKSVHLFVCWIGTHAQYDQLCNNSQQYFVSLY